LSSIGCDSTPQPLIPRMVSQTVTSVKLQV
jgi:hypothetical protein